MKRTGFPTLVISVLALAGLAACGSSDSAGTPNTDPAGATTVAGPPPTAAVPGQTIPPGTAVVVQNDLSPRCEEAVGAIRAVMESYENGYALDAKGAADLQKAMTAAHDESEGDPACGDEEWARFNEKELRGWLAPAK